MDRDDLRPVIFRRTLIGVAILAVSFSLDPVAYQGIRWLIRYEHWGEMREALMTAKFLASGLGSLCIAVVIGMLDPKGRRRATAFLLVVAATAIAAAVTKGFVGRERPSHLDQAAGQERRWAFQGPVVGFPNAPYQSFPSGHTASAFAAATVLTAYYPPARLVFFAVAGGTAVNRVVKHQHFVSDVVAGILLGHLLGLWLLYRPWVYRLWRSEPVDSGGPPA